MTASLVRGCVEMVLALGSVTVLGTLAPLNQSTVGFLYLISVLIIASRRAIIVATIAALAATLCYNFFFLPPLHTFRITGAANWIAMLSFLATALLSNRLFENARRNAARAEAARVEVLSHKESSDLKTSILRAISHDLNSPLTVLTLELDVLRRKIRADEEATPHLARVSEQVALLQRRVESLLSLARFQAGVVEPRPEPVPSADLFRVAREHFGPVAPARTIITTVDDGTPDLMVDPSLALEIVINLIENSHRASPPGASIELHSTRSPLSDHGVLIEVRDHGTGFPANLRQSDGTFQVSDVSGLGLDIALSFARASGGSVEWLARSAGGTIARLQLPSAPDVAAVE